MHHRLLLSVVAGLALLSAACKTDPVYLVLRFENAGTFTGAIDHVGLAFVLDGRVDAATITAASGAAPLTLPMTRVVQIVKGVGDVAVNATAFDANNLVLGKAAGIATVSTRDIAEVTLTFGAGAPDDLQPGADLDADLAPILDGSIRDDLLAPADLNAPDLVVVLPAPVLAVVAAAAVYELGDDGTTPYAWTITGTQDGAALAPIVSADATTLPTGMLPSSNGLGALTLHWLPTFRQAGAYAITVRAQSAIDGSITTQVISITVQNTVDPIGNFYTPSDDKIFNPPGDFSLTVQGIGDFNGDGYEDLVHVVRTRVTLAAGGGNGPQAETHLAFYVMLGSASGFALPPTADSGKITLPAAGVRRSSLVTTRKSSGNDWTTPESYPYTYDYANGSYSQFNGALIDYQIASGRLFPANADDHGKEIFFLDAHYQQGATSSVQNLAQIFALASDAPDGATLVPMLDDSTLMFGSVCPVGQTCWQDYPAIVGGNLDGTDRDQLFVYSSEWNSNERVRHLNYQVGADGDPTLLTTKALRTGGNFVGCKNSTDWGNVQILGLGNVLPGVGQDLVIAQCDTFNNENVIDIADGYFGFPHYDKQEVALSPKSSNAGPSTGQNAADLLWGICDVNQDGFDDLYRFNTRTTPYQIQVLDNLKTSLLDATSGATGGYSGNPFPLDSNGALDESQWKTFTLPAPPSTEGNGYWQWLRCIRGAGQSVLLASRGYNYVETRYQVLSVVEDATGTLVAGPAWPNPIITWPGDTVARPAFGRPRSGGDFNNDGKLDVITAASIGNNNYITSVVYGR